MAIREITVNSLKELVEQTLDIRSKLSKEAFLWYRGLNCHIYENLPKIMRSEKTSTQVFERETRLLARFRQRSMAYWPEGYSQTPWEHLFAMQHYGLPTRLLDWSENLFVATYFALCSACEGHEDRCIPTLWCLDPIRWNRIALSEFDDDIWVLTTADEYLDPYKPQDRERIVKRKKSPVAIYGTHNSGRIVAQRGTFMVWGAGIESLAEFAKTSKEDTLWKISFDGDRGHLFADLVTLGFSETMIFPELASLATELDRTEGWRK